MAKYNEVCDDDLNDYDTLQNEYECLFNDFEKLKHRCKDFKKIIATLALNLENAKRDYDVIENKIELKNALIVLNMKMKLLD